MWNSRPVRILWHSFNWLTRVALICAATGAVLLAIGIMVLRYWLLPNIEQYHEAISTSITRAIGQPVSIEKIAADWQGLRPHLSLINLSMLDEQKHPALVLPSVHVSISWLSLLTAELRFASLEIDRPELLIRRDVQGQMFVGGVAITQSSGNNNLADWLLHQSRMVARNALVVWLDEQRGAPPLVLENVDVRIESLFSHHRFALRAVVPAELASPLDVRGDFRGNSFDDMSSWRGQVFTQLQYADIAAWRAWLNLPKELSRGHGALRGWLDVTAGQVSRLQVDLAVRDVATKLADDVPEMTLRSLRGRATWHALPSGFEIETKRLTMQVENGVSLPTTDLYLRIVNAQVKQAASGEIRANMLQLETLVSLANFVPIPADLRAQLDAFAPRGKVDNLKAQWQGTPQHLSGFVLKGKFQNIALRQVGSLPGFTGLSADIDGDQTSGKLSVASHQLYFDAPSLMREPLTFHNVTGVVNWLHQDKALRVVVDNLLVSNTDVEGRAHGSFQTVIGTPGVLDLSVDLSRADVHQAARYIPLIAVNRKVNDFLHDALLAGASKDFHLRILGNLKDFPFDEQKLGQFEISAQVTGGAVQFAKEWPPIENVQGRLLLKGKKLEVLCSEATSLGVPLRNVSVLLPDIAAAQPSLAVKLKAHDATSHFLQYIQRSPVRGYSKGFTDAITAQGNGDLDFALRIPKLGVPLVEVEGAYHILNNEIDLGGHIPVLHKLNGELRFSQTGLQTHLLNAEILGGPANIDVKTTPTGALASLSGISNMDVLRQNTPHPLLNYLQGGTTWEAKIIAASKSVQVQIDSNLQGMISTLPAPFAKSENAPLPLVINITKPNASGIAGDRGSVSLGNISIELGALLSARITSQSQQGIDTIKRATFNFGGQGQWSEHDGVWLVGRVPELSVQGWEGLFSASKSAVSDASVLPITTGVDLHFSKLRGYGYAVDDLHIVANQRGEEFVAQLDSSVVDGEVIWQPHGYQNTAKLIAHLKHFNLPANTSEKITPASDALALDTNPHTGLQPGTLPTLDVTVEQLEVTGKRLGHLELAGHPDAESWRLRRLILNNPDGSLSGDGVWVGTAAHPQTKVNLLLEISNAGKILDRSGYPNTVKDGSGKLAASLMWPGAPQAFDIKTLEGTLKLDTGKGQFVIQNPGVSKVAGLLSVLSLQALPKHIALDFTDVFSAGFQFDNINGNALIHDGQMSTQDFHIDGSAAKVLLRGGVDLNRETQNLRVEVLPSIASGVSLLGAFVINPVVGISAFVVDKLLGNPLDKLVSFEYNIDGTWADPTVTKVGEKPVPIQTKPTAPLDATEPDNVPDTGKANQPTAQ